MLKELTPAQARYVEYLKTPHWQQLRARILARADEHCEWCGRFCGRNPLAQLYRTGQLPKALATHEVATNTFWRAVFTAAGLKIQR